MRKMVVLAGSVWSAVMKGLLLTGSGLRGIGGFCVGTIRWYLYIFTTDSSVGFLKQGHLVSGYLFEALIQKMEYAVGYRGQLTVDVVLVVDWAGGV